MIIWARICPLKTTSRPSGSSAGCGADHLPSPRSCTCNVFGSSLIVLPWFHGRPHATGGHHRGTKVSMSTPEYPGAPAGPPRNGRNETEAERIDRNVAELLQEL